MKTILVVEDDELLRSILVLALSSKYTTFEASNGEDALALYQEHTPDFVVTDLQMPGMNGRELVKRLRSISSSVVIIVVSVYFDSSETETELLKLGANLCISKPCDLNTLESAISTLSQLD
ncbi:MAG: response regulator [Blastocatellia bacterium]|nr:response regulator [Blastocatellia bacterium]